MVYKGMGLMKPSWDLICQICYEDTSALPPSFLHSFISYSGTPLTDKLGPIHMSHQFMEIPIVFSHCAPLRTLKGSLHLSAWLHKCNPDNFTALVHCTAHAVTFKDWHNAHVYSDLVCMHVLIRALLSPSESHPKSFSPNWTINKPYNMAPQEAPYRPVS